MAKLDNSLDYGEFYIWVEYRVPNECLFYNKIQNGFRCSFWTEAGISTSLMLIDIPDKLLLPGQKKRVLCYTINVEYALKIIATKKVYWGATSCSLGELSI